MGGPILVAAPEDWAASVKALREHCANLERQLAHNLEFGAMVNDLAMDLDWWIGFALRLSRRLGEPFEKECRRLISTRVRTSLPKEKESRG
jgi:hypothetical protein